MIEDLVFNLARQHTASRESILLTELGKLGILDAMDPSNAKHGEIIMFPDQREVFVWRGVPLVEFFPVEMKQEQTADGQVTMKLEQKYRLFRSLTKA